MKTIIAILGLISMNAFAEQQYVHGYAKKDGTYVSPYLRSKANDTVYDNNSYSGNFGERDGKKNTRHDTGGFLNSYDNKDNDNN